MCYCARGISDQIARRGRIQGPNLKQGETGSLSKMAANTILFPSVFPSGGENDT